jgi:hypothetical protein
MRAEAQIACVLICYFSASAIDKMIASQLIALPVELAICTKTGGENSTLTIYGEGRTRSLGGREV